MKTFLCDQCGHPVFFENVQCLQCGAALAFIPERLDLCAVRPVATAAAEATASADDTPVPSGDAASEPALIERIGAPEGEYRRWRMCSNHRDWQACNFTVPEDDANSLCVSCRQTRVLPDLSDPQNHRRWYRIEVAKRRLFYTLACLRLVRTHDVQDPSTQGPVYEFLADLPGEPAVMTGHADGLITLNVAEADDDERVRRRVALHEPYRTLLGHLRHESGHYYWDRLIRDRGRTEAFRAVFGDESQDYGEALKAHYARDPQTIDWKNDYVSTYATSHPWEDWAETWAHYLHMIDLLDTAAAYHTTVAVPGGLGTAEEGVASPFGDEPGEPPAPADGKALPDFDQMVHDWLPVTLMLNSLNRSLGQDDAYPFALGPGALAKLRFVHDVVSEASLEAAATVTAAPAQEAPADPQPTPAAA